MEFADNRRPRAANDSCQARARQEFFIPGAALPQRGNASAPVRPIRAKRTPAVVLALYVAAGSAIGGVTRYLLGIFLQQRAGTGFPVATLVINVTGSLLLGFLMRVSISSLEITPETRVMLTTGFCGGYTTFSTFSYDTAGLMESGQYGRAALYVGFSVVLSLAGTFAGFAAAQSLLGLRERL